MKQRAKQYHRNKRGDEFTNGIIVRHLYDEMTPETLTFWDDAVFIVNDYRVALWWAHPRDQYHQLVEKKALSHITHFHPEVDLFADMTANYKKLGRSCKKVASWTQRPPSDEFRRYFDLLADIERQISQKVSFEVRPSIKVAWSRWCKGLSLSVPFEVRSESDLLALSDVARRLVKRESTIAQEFGDFVYRQADWLADCKVTQKSNPSFIISHSLT